MRMKMCTKVGLNLHPLKEIMTMMTIINAVSVLVPILTLVLSFSLNHSALSNWNIQCWPCWKYSEIWYRGFRKYRISWYFPLYPLFPEICYFRLFNGEFQFGDFENVCYFRKSGISESSTSENLCNYKSGNNDKSWKYNRIIDDALMGVSIEKSHNNDKSLYSGFRLRRPPRASQN